MGLGKVLHKKEAELCRGFLQVSCDWNIGSARSLVRIERPLIIKHLRSPQPVSVCNKVWYNYCPLISNLFLVGPHDEHDGASI